MRIMSEMLQYLENINLYMFSMMNATHGSSPLMISAGKIIAVYFIDIFPLVMALNLFSRERENGRTAYLATLAGGLALLVDAAIRSLWYHPRPFAAGTGYTWLHHAANASFPSNHMTFAATVAAAFLFARRTRRQGIFLLGISLLIAWSRIYTGVHFPLDMAGSVVVALGVLTITYRCRGPLVRPWLYLAGAMSAFTEQRAAGRAKRRCPPARVARLRRRRKAANHVKPRTIGAIEQRQPAMMQLNNTTDNAETQTKAMMATVNSPERPHNHLGHRVVDARPLVADD
ncbi:undecaprenyl-diphosphatase [Affinibrenneria salicis]|uniref:undecaprenyl-diphosphate phosphatase n=1 Tax=Affinibrenneria salicis TaxID=2590031 RepID=A0A5J5G1W1_9GAMM|nr:undecaprenyl-diphosphatase [Affinibrenneria salicis]